MVDEHGEDVEEAYPSRPVQVIGFTSVPGAGDNFLVVDEDRLARRSRSRMADQRCDGRLGARVSPGLGDGKPERGAIGVALDRHRPA